MKKTSALSRIAALLLSLTMLSVMILPVLAEEEEELPAQPPITNCDAALLYNFENDRYLFEYNASERVFPASTVKIMTAIVAMEAFEGKLDSKITVTQSMLDEVAGNRIGFWLGEVVTVEQMLTEQTA